MGQRWYSKACGSDREAVGLINPARSGPKRTEVYCYLGGGSLTEVSMSHANLATWLRAWFARQRIGRWRWLCVAVSLITAAVPEPTTFLEKC